MTTSTVTKLLCTTLFKANEVEMCAEVSLNFKAHCGCGRYSALGF